jgi:predicted DNA-binding ribbon-helix-helix protein
MQTKTIYFFEEQIEDSEILAKELGLKDFSSFVRVCVQEKLRKNAKIIEQRKREKAKQKQKA